MRGALPPFSFAVRGAGVVAGESRLLAGVDLAGGTGQFIGLVGPNGAGKTTMLRAIAGYLPLSEGSIELGGQDSRRLSTRQRAQVVATVPQSTDIEGAITVLELVMLGRHPYLGRLGFEGEKDRAIVQLAMRATTIEQFADRRAATLSAGERQRALIARALAQEPRLLLLDEPTAHLDLRAQIEVFELVRRLADDGLAVLAAVHDLQMAADYCDRVVVLQGGRVLAHGSPAEAITAANIEQAFAVRADVVPDPVTGRPRLLRVQPAAAQSRASRGRVHVIAGGGRGAPVINRLTAEGYTVTVGALGEGDTDLQAARLAGAEAIVHQAFAQIDEQLDRQHRALLRQAACVVLPDVCWGQSNLANLRAAIEAEHIIVVAGEPLDRRDFTGGQARALLEQVAGRAIVTTLQDLPHAVGTTLTKEQHS